MKINERIVTEYDLMDDVICDCCGKTCKTKYNYECLELKAHWGYGTKSDGEKWTAEICEACVIEKLTFIKFTKHINF